MSSLSSRPRDAGGPGTSRRSASKFQITTARPADHSAIHHLLVSVFHGPSPTEFQAQLDHPTYETTDRLLVKCDGRVVSHLRLQHRTMWFGQLTVPVTHVSDVATLPEYRGQGLASALIKAADKMIREGHSTSQIVKAVGLTSRTIERRRARLRVAGAQRDLFQN